jgi:hypothetical protein
LQHQAPPVVFQIFSSFDLPFFMAVITTLTGVWHQLGLVSIQRVCTSRQLLALMLQETIFAPKLISYWAEQ